MRWWLVLLFFAVLFVPVAAENITCEYVHQGDTVYWGDCIDVTGVAGWDMKLAHWNNTGGYDIGYPDEYPDIIYDVSDNPRKIHVWWEVYPSGPWYKWSGKRENAGNNLAFYVAKGREAGNKTINQTNITPTPSLYAPQTFSTTLTPQIIYETIIVVETVKEYILVNNTVMVPVTPAPVKKSNDWGYSALGILALSAVVYGGYKALKK